MSLFIANTTNQRWHHHFRVPEMTRPYFVQIPAGRQVQVPKSFSPASEQAVISQLERYGARPASAVNGKLEDFPGLFYSTSKPISESAIVHGHEAVIDRAMLRSAEEAKMTALGFDKANRDPNTNERMASESEVEIIEQVPRGRKPTGKETKFSLSVSPNGSDKMPKA